MSKSIAEIIGWTHVGYDDWIELPWYKRPDEAQVQPSTEPTVDDIRAWLHEQDCSVWAGEDADTPLLLNGAGVRLWVVTDRSSEVKAPTLLEALEQAVRLMAGET